MIKEDAALLLSTRLHLMKMIELPPLYHKHIEEQLKLRFWVILKILIALIQNHRWIRLETLANQLRNFVKFESRRRALQRFLS